LGEDGFEEVGGGPAIEDQVVVGADQMVFMVADLDQGQSHQGWGVQVEGLALVAVQENLQAGGLEFGELVAPVLLHPGQFGLSVNDLKGFVPLFPIEGGAEDVVVSDGLLPGLVQGRGIQCSLQGQHDLGHVDAGLWGQQGVEQDALLHGRQGIDIGDFLAFIHSYPLKIRQEIVEFSLAE